MSSSPNLPSPTRFLGCDVGKASIVVFDSVTAQTKTLPNTAAGLLAFTATLDDTCLLVCESTGGYETALLEAAIANGRAAHRADARKVKHFIRSRGTLGKTDALDARALAHYGQERHRELARWQAPDRQRARLQALVQTRRDLVGQRQACANRRDAPGAEPVAPYLTAVHDCLSTQIEAIDKDIAALLKAQASLAQATAALRTIVSIGQATAAALLALMPELGHLTRRQAAALAGLAPHPKQSGTADRYRPTHGGRPQVRQALFMAALVAARHNPVLSTFYKRLIANGKKPIVATTAVMRKLITIANAVLKNPEKALKTAKQVS